VTQAAPRKPPPKPTAEKLPAIYALGDRAIILRKLEEAQWCFERAMELEPNAPRPYMGLAQVRQLQGKGVLARALVMDALRRGADPAESYVLLGRFFQFDGDFDSAQAAFERALQTNPSHGQAHLCLALLRPPADSAAHVAELERIAKLPSVGPEHRATLDFALARAHEKAGNVDAAFAAYKRANALRRAQFPPDTDLPGAARRMIAFFTPAFVQSHRDFGSPSERPVFIVGMMRSGTSLVEQILASHPQVHGHGERTEITQIAMALHARLNAGPYPECLAQLDQATAARYAAGFIALFDRDAPNAARNIDKLPHNFEHLGLISLLFPRARIIHCVRDPIDTCLSNYFQDFAEKNTFTYDLRSMGEEYRTYQRLMAHWQAVLPNPMLTIQYEDLVADQAGVSRRAVEFLGLPWDEACLNFHANPRPVFTKSLWQVRQPIYHDAVARWRRYQRHLGPLFDALGITPPPTP
jgi:tetratricopeptide (TPR) repeat protein